MLALIQQAAPNNPPDAQMAMAGSSQSAGSAIDQAQSLAAYGNAATQLNGLKAMSADDQRRAWSGMDPNQQAMLSGAGYRPPSHGRGLFSRVIHDVLGAPSALFHEAEQLPVVGAGFRDVGRTLGHAGSYAGRALTDLGAGLRFTQHAFRTGAMYNAEHHGGNLVFNNPLGDLLGGVFGTAAAGADHLHLIDASDWADAWHKTTRGDQTFDPNKARDIQANSGYDALTFDFAKAVAASDRDTAQYLAQQQKAGMSPDDVTALEMKTNDPNFQKIVTQLKDAKLSFGRSLVPQAVWNHAPWLGNVVSGLGDAAFSFSDPFLAGGKIAKAAKLAQYSFRSVDELNQVLDKPGVQRWMGDVAGYLERGDTAGLIARHPQLTEIAPKLAQSGATTAQDLTNMAKIGPEDISAVKDALAKSGIDKVGNAQELADFTKTHVLAMHILAGRGTVINHGVQAVPSLSAAGSAALDAKGVLKKAIDWTKDVSIDAGDHGALNLAGRALTAPVNFLGETAKKMTTLVNEPGPLDPNSAGSLLQVQRFARYYLDNNDADALVNAWSHASTLDEKRNIYMEMMRQTFQAMGVHLSDDNSLMEHFLTTTRKGVMNQKYAAHGIDFVKNDDGTISAHGIFENQLTDQWALPSYRDLAANVQRSSAMSMLYKTANNPITDKISYIWKPLQLLRVGFPIRVALEEMAGGVARNGPINMAKAALAGKAIEGEYGMRGPLSDLNPIEGGVSRFLRELDARDVPGVKTAQDLQAKLLAGRAQTYMKVVAGKTPGADAYEQTAREYSDLFQNGLSSEISSQHGRMLGFANDPADMADDIKTGITTERMGFRPKTGPSGNFKEYEGSDAGFMNAWMGKLDELAGSGLGRKILQNLGEEPEQLRAGIADYIESPGFAPWREKAARNLKLSDGRKVGFDATSRQAAEDWADVAIQHVNQTLPEIAKHRDSLVGSLLQDGKVSHMGILNKIPRDLRPDVAVGPEFVSLPGSTGGLFREFVDRGFSRIGHAIDYMSRQPLYLDAVHRADKDLAPVVKEIFGDNAMAGEVRHALVKQRADAETLAYVHNPRIKSQMNIITQTLLPFQFAQDQFWKRWARNFYHSPEALREAQLTHHALGASGVVHTDDQGNEIFTYPATGAVQTVLSDAFSHLGIPASLPVAQAFTGQLKMVAPGLDRTFSPSFGPLVSMPLNQATKLFPELMPVTHAALGDIGTGRPSWEQFIPASVSRVVNAVIANDAITPSYVTAQNRAIQDLYATGHGLGPNPSPHDREMFMRRVANNARIGMFVRALIGFGTPAAPSMEIGNTKIGHELRVLGSSGLNLSQAIQSMVKKDPDLFPYAVFMSQGAGRETLPATEQSLKVLESNPEFFKDHPDAGGFFLPAQSPDNKFSNEAYKDQMLYAMRKRRSPKEYLDQLMYTQAAGDYFDTRDAYQQRVAGLHGQAKDAAGNEYQQWKADYLNLHPVFADKLQSATALIERQRTMANLKVALADPRAPQSPQVSDIKDLVDTYDGYKARLTGLAGMTSRSASNARKAETALLSNWASGWLAQHPGALDVFNMLIKPEIGGTD